MTPNSHVEPSKHSTEEVDAKLRQVEDKVARAEDAGSPAIKPNDELAPDGKPVTETPRNPEL